MTKFLYQIEAEEKEENIEIKLYYSNKKQQIEEKKDTIPYILYIKKEDFEKIEGLEDHKEKIKVTNKNLINAKKETIFKLEIKSREIYQSLSEKFKNYEKETYEKDIPYEHKYLIENEINISKDEDNYTIPKYISVDIETINENNPEVVMISTHSPFLKNMSKVYVNKEKINNNLDKENKTDYQQEYEIVIEENEKKLLEKFRDDLIKFEPAIILGWNVIDFDFKVIKQRMKYHDLEFKFSKFCQDECLLKIFSDFFKQSSMRCEGVLVFDVINLLKINFIQFDDYKLETVAKEILGEGKIKIGEEEEEKSDSIENLLQKDPKKLAQYNFIDSKLVSQIIEETNLLELMCKRSVITGTPLSKVKSPIATLDLMYLKKLHKKGIVAPNIRNVVGNTPIEGAYVIEPKKGIYDDIFVFDFKSLYPSIIMTFNIDPYSYDNLGEIEAPNGARFKKNKAILPNLIKKLFEERESAKKDKNKTKAFALKTTMNSFYGAIASPKSRYYNKYIGEAITSFGRQIIKKSKEYIENKNHEVIYGDTDSIFIKPNKKFKDFEEKKEYAKELEKQLNDFLTDWINKNFGTENKLNIELEKIFSKFFIASKKRYAGFDQFKQEKDIVGLEAIRGDWTPLAQKFQIELLDRVFEKKSKEQISQFMKEYAEKLKSGEFDDKIIYRKKITKPLEQYTKTTPPHVKAARELDKFSGRIVDFIMTVDGPKHIDLIDENTKIDYKHYIEKQLKGVSDDILEVLDINFDEALGNNKQESLNKFF